MGAHPAPQSSRWDSVGEKKTSHKERCSGDVTLPLEGSCPRDKKIRLWNLSVLLNYWKEDGKAKSKAAAGERNPQIQTRWWCLVSSSALSCCFALLGTKCLVGLGLLRESRFKESCFLNLQSDKNEHWNKNVTCSQQRTIALRGNFLWTLKQKYGC